MRIKPGVKIDKLTAPMALGGMIVSQVYLRYGYNALLTSGNDGIHTGKPVKGDTQDPHYEGKALDWGVHEIKPEDLPHLIDTLTLCLGDEFYIKHESPGLPNEHLHVQHGRVGLTTWPMRC